MRTDFEPRYEDCFALDLCGEGLSLKQLNLRDNPRLLDLNLATFLIGGRPIKQTSEFMQHLKALARPSLNLI